MNEYVHKQNEKKNTNNRLDSIIQLHYILGELTEQDLLKMLGTSKICSLNGDS